jgi:hypothetical protein
MERKSKGERLAIFLKRLGALPTASTAREAIDQLAETLNAVEDEFSGIPFAPETRGMDGRMYPVQMDNARRLDEFQATRLRSKGHHTLVGDDGSIEIREAFGEKRIILTKPGADGRSMTNGADDSAIARAKADSDENP